ncbi:SpoIIIAH-like family protein [Paenibacillus sp. MER TA 81-3]|uniref:SpoIIIAH-like family protein n=1 Tax=Paenibacillus sp. MER TA 81-3 TaxID=2939573 RepID=UPI00203D3058|nr:SpoIIIAH-like family protein [Paenibacillus sp. MER TA 81-3]MCM3340259.1 SpoIIIAH-like family protein [Paenibacillus sp. MER TA 81-3]
MNTKRQTIWLVSMLSLMVVLSAYYLFTEDTPSPLQETADNVRMGEQLKGDATEVSQLPEIQVTPVSTGDEAESKATGNAAEGSAMTGEGAGTNGAATTQTDAGKAKDDQAGAAATPQDTDAKTDAEDGAASAGNAKTGDKEQAILDQIEAEGVMKRSMIEEKQMQRNEQYQQDMERLMAMINDSNTTGDKWSQAYEEMNVLDERETKITNLESELQKEYDNAVITQDNDRYKVVVQSDKMEVKEAVDIIDKLMKELNVTQDKVSVQYVSE